MKNYFKFISLIIIGSLLLFTYGCEKEVIDNSILQEEVADNNNPPNETIFNSPVNPCYASIFDSIQVVNGMLKFIDMDHLEDVYNCLEYLYEENQLEFDSTYGHLSSVEMDSIEIVVGFNHWEPYEALEMQLNFSSRREYIENLIIAFLDQENPDWNNDPDDLDGLDETIRTLINIDGYVMVGLDTFNLIYNENPATNNGESTERSGSCSIYQKEVENDFIPGYSNRRYKHKAKFNGIPLKITFKGKIVNIRKRNNGKWRRSRADLFIDIGGHGWDSTCSSSAGVYTKKERKNRRELKTTHITLSESPRHIKSGEVSSWAEIDFGSGVFRNLIVLEW